MNLKMMKMKISKDEIKERKYMTQNCETHKEKQRNNSQNKGNYKNQQYTKT